MQKILVDYADILGDLALIILNAVLIANAMIGGGRKKTTGQAEVRRISGNKVEITCRFG